MSTALATTQSTAVSMFSNSELFALVQRQATLIAASSLIPKEFQNNVPNCAIALEMASRLGASPFAVIQNLDVIHGRPSWRAVFLMGLVNNCGRFTPLQFKLEPTGKEKTVDLVIEGWDPTTKGKRISRKIPYTYTPTRCVAWAKDKATGDVIEGPPVSYDMAIEEGWTAKEGSKWLTEMRELMLRYRAASFFAKVYASDVMLGMQTSEEEHDLGPAMRNVTPPEETLAGALTNNQPAAATTATAEVVTEPKRVRPAPKPVAAAPVETSQEIDPTPPTDNEPNLIEPTPEELAAAKELRDRIVKGVGAIMKAKKLKLDAVEAGLKDIGWLGHDKLSECTNEELQNLIDNPDLLDFPTAEAG